MIDFRYMVRNIMIVHSINPLFNENSEFLILGSFPSVKSREQGFYYGHPQNRFWRVMAKLCRCGVPETIEEKTKLILDNHFALWDVIHSCEIEGSSDSSISNVTVNNISPILNTAKIRKIFVNGKKAESLYKKYLEKEIGIVAVCLPSTSPANAAWSEERLFDCWQEKMGNPIFRKTV